MPACSTAGHSAMRHASYFQAVKPSGELQPNNLGSGPMLHHQPAVKSNGSARTCALVGSGVGAASRFARCLKVKIRLCIFRRLYS